MSRDSIITEIAAERARQDDLWGGAEHDDRHSLAQWLVILVTHVGLAGWDGSPDDVCHREEATRKYDPERYRKELVRVAAVAVAALEAFDRKQQQEAPPPPCRLTPQQLAWGRRVAADLGEAVLLLDRRQDVMRRVEECGLHAVGASQADGWQAANALGRVEPPAPEVTS